MLDRDKTLLVVIDVQEKLCPAIHDVETVVDHTSRLVRGAAVLGIPVIYTEQNPARLGPTVPELSQHLTGQPIAKMAFGCCGEPGFAEAVKASGRTQILLAGIETHVCVYQTAAGLRSAGHDVHVVTDAVSSRTPANKAVGIEKMTRSGCEITSVEMALFELLQVAEGDAFKAILQIVK